MLYTIRWVYVLFFFLIGAGIAFSPSASALTPPAIPAPKGYESRISQSDADTSHLLQGFLGLPYREDGALDELGQFVLFQVPTTPLSTPGLNCSGFVLEASRFLLNTNIPIATAMADRKNDSGPGSPLGQDWDFGWDLIANIADKRSATLLLPDGKTAAPAALSGSVRGFDVHAPATWKELPTRLRSGYLYLVSFSKPSTLPGYTLQHYHVGLIWVSPAKELWYYHTTGQAKGVTRRDLATPEGRSSFQQAFANKGNARKFMAIIEIPLPPGR